MGLSSNVKLVESSWASDTSTVWDLSQGAIWKDCVFLLVETVDNLSFFVPWMVSIGQVFNFGGTFWLESLAIVDWTFINFLLNLELKLIYWTRFHRILVYEIWNLRVNNPVYIWISLYLLLKLFLKLLAEQGDQIIFGHICMITGPVHIIEAKSPDRLSSRAGDIIVTRPLHHYWGGPPELRVAASLFMVDGPHYQLALLLQGFE